MSYGQLTTTRERPSRSSSEPVPASDIDRLCALLGDEWGPDWGAGTDVDMVAEFPELAAQADRSHRAPGIPDGLDDMTPGPVLTAFLSSIDIGEVSGFDQVTVLRAHQRMASHHQARMYTAMTAIKATFEESEDGIGPVDAAQDTAVEIGTALHLTRRAADNEVLFALDLQQRLPRVYDMLESGAIDQRRARCIDDETMHLPIATARNVVERIAEAAPELTTGQLRARIKRLCIEADGNVASSVACENGNVEDSVP